MLVCGNTLTARLLLPLLSLALLLLRLVSLPLLVLSGGTPPQSAVQERIKAASVYCMLMPEITNARKQSRSGRV
jgi:hypothetical protein